MADKEKRLLDKFILPVILLLVAAVIGGFVERFWLGESPELSYQITESQPIPTGVKEYYTTGFYVSNTGNVPLTNVVLNAPFRDTIATVRIHPSLTKKGNVITGAMIQPDSLTLDLNFDLAAEEQCSVTIVSAGRLKPENFILKSDQVLGKKMDIKTTETTWLLTQFILVIIVFVMCMFAFSLYVRVRDSTSKTEINLQDMEKLKKEMYDTWQKLEDYRLKILSKEEKNVQKKDKNQTTNTGS